MVSQSQIAQSVARARPNRANISALQDSLYVAGCCFALPSREVTTFQHTRSPRCIGCLLPDRLFVTRTGLPPASRRQLFRTHEPVLGAFTSISRYRFSTSSTTILILSFVNEYKIMIVVNRNNMFVKVSRGIFIDSKFLVIQPIC